MLDRGKISAGQAGFLMFTFLMGSVAVIVPSIATSFANQDGWLVIILAALIGVGVVLIFTSLGLLFPKQSIIQYSELILGKWLGKTVGLLYVLYPFYLGSLVTGLFRDYVTITALPRTPPIVVSGLLLAVIAYAVRGGIESLGRVNELILPFRELIVLLVILMLITDFKWNNLSPFMGEGVLPVVKGTISTASLPFGETIVFAMLLPNIRNIQKVKRVYILAVVFGGLLLSISVLTSILVLGPEVASRLNFPTHEVIKYIEKLGFMTDMDILGMLLWISSGFMKIAVCYYCTAVGLAQWCRLSDYRSVVIPIGILIYIFSIVAYGSIVEDAVFAKAIWPFFSIPFVLLFPLLMLIIAKIRGLDGRERESAGEG
ncbi:spore germination protein KB [Paenibacillus forsythiae]|uniref:Spore germination protein KB n=1 Tax=Paenibacillus forsythiae TaxID=365616 RepID=A0ABU3H3D0_9BACL|nr:endospore germination permease [Paenibacillus forsythiae]MDT3425336.1 spore germination protein KB [Paenibacillus forsythiae]